jgi:hypothetical protein
MSTAAYIVRTSNVEPMNRSKLSRILDGHDLPPAPSVDRSLYMIVDHSYRRFQLAYPIGAHEWLSIAVSFQNVVI